MKCIQIPLGAFQTNCYILINEQQECILFDPGSQGEELKQFLIKEGLHPLAVVLTHAHFDHIGAVDSITEQWDIPVYVHELEGDWLGQPTLNGSERFGEKITAQQAEQLLSTESELQIGSFTLELFHTPGHSPGSLSYYIKDLKAIIAGDTLFSGSIGRTDLYGGDHQQLLESIHSQLLVFPPETEIMPGHGPTTTIAAEIKGNPFLN